jgi:type I restriction enzyme S subunit
MRWKYAQLSELAEIVGGGTPSKSCEDFWGGTIPWVSPKDMTAREIFDTQDHVTEKGVSESSTQIVPAGSILVVVRSGILTRKFPIAIARRPLALNQDIKALLPNKIIDPEFLAYVLESRSTEILTGCVKRGATVHSVDMLKFQNLSFPLPPLSEQRYIVMILKRIDELRIKRAAAILKFQQIRPALFINTFGKIDDIKDWISLDEIVQEFRYGTSNRSEASGYVTLRIPNVVQGHLSLDDLKLVPVTPSEFERIKLLQGDLLLVRTNGNPEYVGRSAIFDRELATKMNLDPEKIIFASYLIRARLDFTKVDPLFIQTYISLPEGRKALRRRIRTSAGQYNINTESLRGILVPRIDVERQRLFTSKVQSVEKLSVLQTHSRNHLDNIFKSVISSMLSGELGSQWRRVHDQQLAAELVDQAEVFGPETEIIDERAV